MSVFGSPHRLRSFLASLSPEFWLIAFACGMWAATTLHVYQTDLLKTHYDEYTHIISARLMLESITPGFSQLGFWAPLLHVVLLPFFTVPVLAYTGLSSSFALLPFLLVSVVLLYRTLRICVKRAWIAFFGAALFSMNPYVLFFSVTPMAEMLLIASLIGTMYYFVRWLFNDELSLLVHMGLCVSLACVSRFEGFFLLPIATLAVAVFGWKRGYGFAKWRAYMIIFILPAISGIAFIVLYSLAYSSDIFAYATYSLSSGISSRTGSAATAPKVATWLLTFYKIGYASKHMISAPLVVVGCVTTVALIAFARQRLRNTFILLMAAAPLFFVYGTVYYGRLGLVVPELSAGGYNNVRYALPIILIAVFSLSVAWDKCCALLVRWKPAYYACSFLFLSAWLGVSASHLVGEAFANPAYPPMSFERVTETLRPDLERIRQEYDYGNILTLRYRNDHFLEEFGLPLSVFILEGNYRYFDQAVKEPWLFARWVVFSKRGRLRFPEFDKLENSSEFQRFFTYMATVEAGPDTLYFYRLNDRVFREVATSLGYDTSLIPSLTPEAEWDPLSFYENLKGSQR